VRWLGWHCQYLRRGWRKTACCNQCGATDSATPVSNVGMALGCSHDNKTTIVPGLQQSQVRQGAPFVHFVAGPRPWAARGRITAALPAALPPHADLQRCKQCVSYMAAAMFGTLVKNSFRSTRCSTIGPPRHHYTGWASMVPSCLCGERVMGEDIALETPRGRARQPRVLQSNLTSHTCSLAEASGTGQPHSSVPSPACGGAPAGRSCWGRFVWGTAPRTRGTQTGHQRRT
jgi:hypothetical protein